MKHLAFIIISSLLCVPKAFSQTSIIKFDAVCTSKIELAEVLSEYQELPLARGNSSRGAEKVLGNPLLLFVNPTTRTWTIAEQVSEDIVCVIALGTQFSTLIDQQEQEEIQAETIQRKRS